MSLISIKIRQNSRKSSNYQDRVDRQNGVERGQSALLGPAGPSERTTLLSVPLLAKPFVAQTAVQAARKDIWQLLSCSYTNILLAVVPFGLLSPALHWNPIAIFCLNFLAIIPFQGLISYISEDLSVYLGSVLGGLFNTILGSATEFIVNIIALTQHETRLVQGNIAGTVFLNMLLTPSVCTFVGGLNYREQIFGGSALSIFLFPTLASVMALFAPAALYAVAAEGIEGQHTSISLSLGCAVILLLFHAASLTFQLKTHANLFDEDMEGEETEQDIGPETKWWTAAICLLLILVLLSFCAQNLVRSIPSIIKIFGLSQAFIGFLVLPLLNCTTDLVTAAIVASLNKLDLALSVSTASTTNTVLFVFPVLVIIGSATGQHLTLFFDKAEVVAVLFAVILFAALVHQGASTYLTGLLHLGLYSIIVATLCVLPLKS